MLVQCHKNKLQCNVHYTIYYVLLYYHVNKLKVQDGQTSSDRDGDMIHTTHDKDKLKCNVHICVSTTLQRLTEM